MKTINTNAPVISTKEITINSNIHTVWKILTSIVNWPNWQTEIIKVNTTNSLKPGSKFSWKSGGVNINSTIHTIEPENNFGWTGKAMGIYAIHNWSVDETNGITTVKVEESMEGLVARLFNKSLTKSLETGLQNWLMLLKKECEK